MPELTRIIVAIDPAVTSGEDADETGIIVAGKDVGGRGYVLADRSGHYAPTEWAKAAIELYRQHKADRIVGESVSSARESYYIMVDNVEAPDPATVVFHLKFATGAFLPALADPYAWIYKKEILDKDPRWYEKNVMGSGPFTFAEYQLGQSIKGVRNPDYYHQGLPYLDGFTGIYADRTQRDNLLSSVETARERVCSD